jgi:hypothetical protein
MHYALNSILTEQVPFFPTTVSTNSCILFGNVQADKGRSSVQWLNN